MRTFGGITTVFGAATILQSIFVSLVLNVEGAGDPSGFIGLIVGALIVIGGLISFSEGKNKNYHFRTSINILLIIIFLISAILGFACHGTFTDLMVWSTWSLFSFLIVLFNMIFPGNSKKEEKTNNLETENK